MRVFLSLVFLSVFLSGCGFSFAEFSTSVIQNAIPAIQPDLDLDYGSHATRLISEVSNVRLDPSMTDYASVIQILVSLKEFPRVLFALVSFLNFRVPDCFPPKRELQMCSISDSLPLIATELKSNENVLLFLLRCLKSDIQDVVDGISLLNKRDWTQYSVNEAEQASVTLLTMVDFINMIMSVVTIMPLQKVEQLYTITLPLPRKNVWKALQDLKDFTWTQYSNNQVVFESIQVLSFELITAPIAAEISRHLDPPLDLDNLITQYVELEKTINTAKHKIVIGYILLGIGVLFALCGLSLIYVKRGYESRILPLIIKEQPLALYTVVNGE